VTRVAVETGSRLHLGFTNLGRDLGRGFGSIGVAIDRPSTSVVVEESDTLEVHGEDREAVRAAVQRFCGVFAVEPRVRVTVRNAIPEHVGLGSGTQLALAVGAGLAAICRVDTDTAEIAAAVNRGRRSGIGVAAFAGGGFIVDAGVALAGADRSRVATVVWRHDMPADWCFVVAVPKGGEGLNSTREEKVFAALEPSVRVSEEVCRITQLQLMPALVERDLEAFGRALTAIDSRTGSYFAKVQGGLYSHAATEDLIALMLSEGAAGAGQSSWGPAVYGVVREPSARRLQERARDFLAARALGEAVFVCHGRNTPAQVEVRREEL